MGFVTPSILADWNISRPAFGLVMSAARPSASSSGAAVAGPSSNRFGRKPVLIVSVLIFGLFTAIAASATSPAEMALLRFLAGTGMGAAMPNTSTLLSEYAPLRRRSLMITIMFTGFNLGSAAIGFCRRPPDPGPWVALGAAPRRRGAARPGAVPGPVSTRVRPASHLARCEFEKDRCDARPGDRAPLRRTEIFVTDEPPLPDPQADWLTVLAGYAVTTVALWVTYFMGLLVIYLLTGWLPTLMRDAGLSIETASTVTALFQIGGTPGCGDRRMGDGQDAGRPSSSGCVSRRRADDHRPLRSPRCVVAGAPRSSPQGSA